MPLPRSLITALALVLAAAGACGPSVPSETDATGSDGSSSASTGRPTTGPPLTTTDGTTMADTTGVDTAETTDGMFISRPDGCGAAPGGTSFHCTFFECDYVLQDCPRGSKCMPWANDGGNAWVSARCSPLDPDPVEPGGACTMQGSPVSGVLQGTV